MDELPTLGFVGLGMMGASMADRLLDQFGAVSIFDVREEVMAPLIQKGAMSCASPKEVADRAEIVLVSLATPDVVLAVVAGDGGLLGGSAMKTFVDLSTTGVAGAERVAGILAEHDIDYLEAPVSGGPVGAREGTLAVMAAGSDEVFARCEPYLKVIGANVMHVGKQPGHGQLTKVINNLLSATAIAITGEALAFGVKGGLDTEQLLAVLNVSSGRNTASMDKYPRCVLPRTFDFGFRMRLMAKDVALCLEEAMRQKVPMVLGSTVQELWSIANAQASDEDDCMEYARMIEGWTGVTIGGLSNRAS